MLQQRILTAFFLFLFLFIAAFYFNELLFFLFLTAITTLAIWEWSQLTGIASPAARAAYSVIVIGLFVLAYFFLSNILPVLLLLSLCFWVLAFILILLYPAFSSVWDKKILLALIGLPVLFPCWYGLLSLREEADFIYVFIGLFLLVGAADTGAYFAGKYLGKHKLAVRVSPNKTWEGVAGGMLCCIAVTYLYSLIQSEQNEIGFSLPALILVPFLVTSFSITGDLFESMLKRNRNLKDSGNLLPGHGGILDRIDGVVAAAPVYLLSMQIFV